MVPRNRWNEYLYQCFMQATVPINNTIRTALKKFSWKTSLHMVTSTKEFLSFQNEDASESPDEEFLYTSNGQRHPWHQNFENEYIAWCQRDKIFITKTRFVKHFCIYHTMSATLLPGSTSICRVLPFLVGRVRPWFAIHLLCLLLFITSGTSHRCAREYIIFSSTRMLIACHQCKHVHVSVELM